MSNPGELHSPVSAAPSRVSLKGPQQPPFMIALLPPRVFEEPVPLPPTRHSTPAFARRVCLAPPSKHVHLPLSIHSLLPPLSGASASWPPLGKGAQTYFPIRFMTFNVTHSSDMSENNSSVSRCRYNLSESTSDRLSRRCSLMRL